jgi:hypothetical protein
MTLTDQKNTATLFTRAYPSKTNLSNSDQLTLWKKAIMKVETSTLLSLSGPLN